MKHLTFHDYLAYKTLGTPLPCHCSQCQERIGLWESLRKLPQKEAEAFSPASLSLKQEVKKLKMGYAWAVAGAACAAILVIVFLIIPSYQPPQPATSSITQEQIQEVEELYNKPVLGDLEAISLLYEEAEQHSQIHRGGENYA